MTTRPKARRPASSAQINPKHFDWRVEGKVGIVTLNHPERKNALTFAGYAELVETFECLRRVSSIKAVVITGAGENFCSGGDVHDIIGPLVAAQKDSKKLLAFTRMTGALVKAMRACPQPVISAIDGVCAGAGAIIAMASDLRIGTSRSRVAFLFVRVGLSGADMGACALLPRIVGQGRASELLYTGRFLSADEAERWSFYNRVVIPEQLLEDATHLAHSLANGPALAHAITKRCLHDEWDMALDAAIEAEARAQVRCMQTGDFARAYRAFLEKRDPIFEGN